ncbi:MAG: hypothetical protein KAR21_08975 [Spirochaetales bacterium]|nr:hypothetical protein [Spirochaetales bacterium]
MKPFIIALLLIVFITIPLFSGESLPEYEPYQEDEFPQWAKDLRRAEIIFFGTIPFSFFYSSFSYDFYRYAINNFDESFAPAIFGNKTPPIRTNEEKWQIIIASVSLSAVLVLVDYLLGQPWND